MSLFTVKDYRSFISEKISENKAIRGYQTRLSEAAGVHSSYISRVINSHIHLTTDQAANLAEFWRLDPEETDYFIDLVLLERSSSATLKTRIQQRLGVIHHNRQQLARRFSHARPMDERNADIYFSAWYFSAIHILITIPQYRTVRAIAKRLRLSEALVNEALEILSSIGLARYSQSQWIALQNDIHLAQQKMFSRIQHNHWRQKTSLKLQEGDPEALHYSGIHSMSISDAHKLKALLIQFLDESRKTIAASPEQELFFLGCDFYEV